MAGLVKFFRSSDAGAFNDLNNVAGKLISLFDACLVDGYGSVTLSSLVVSGGVATATVSTGHGFPNYISDIGPVILIEGATPSELNGEVRINAVSATQFTFSTAAADGTATGTITAKRAPAGWSKVFSGTNKAVYRSNTTRVGASRMFLHVDDTGSYARVRGWSYLEDVDALNGLDPFPMDSQVSGGLYVLRSSSSTPRDWILVADDESFYYIPKYSGTDIWNGSLVFANLKDLALAGDAFQTYIAAMTSTSLTDVAAYVSTAGRGYVCRGISQQPLAVIQGRSGCPINGTYALPTATTWPPQGDGKMPMWPITHWEGSVYRGTSPIFRSSQNRPEIGTFLIDNSQNKKCFYFSFSGNASGMANALDVLGPWYD